MSAGGTGDRPIGEGVHIALSRHAHDRIADRRVDADWLADVWQDPATRVLVVAGTRFRLDEGHVPWVSPHEAPDGTRVLLGDLGGVVHFAVIVAPDRADESWTGLRGVIRKVDEKEAALVVHAIGIAEWLFATRHCPRCGGELVAEQLGHVLRCASCGREEFPRTDPAVIMVVVDGEAPTTAASSAAIRRGRPGSTPPWPASSSRASPSSRRCGARSSRSPGSGSVRSATSGASRGRSRAA